MVANVIKLIFRPLKHSLYFLCNVWMGPISWCVCCLWLFQPRLMFMFGVRRVAYLGVGYLKGASLGQALAYSQTLDFAVKACQEPTLQLIGPFISYKENKVLWMGPRVALLHIHLSTVQYLLRISYTINTTVFPANIRLGVKCLRGANTLAYNFYSKV